MEFTGGRTENEIVNWIMKKVGPASTETTCEGLKKTAADAKLALAYFGDDAESKEYKTFLEVTSNSAVGEKFQFVHLHDKECAASFGAAHPSVVLFRQFDNSPVVYAGSFETQAIVDWMTAHSVPTLIEFSEDYIEPIFGARQSAIFLFRSAADSSSDFAKVFEQAAQELKGQILFVVSGVTDGIQARLAEFVGVDSTTIPTVKILNPSDNMKKF